MADRTTSADKGIQNKSFYNSIKSIHRNSKATLNKGSYNDYSINDNMETLNRDRSLNIISNPKLSNVMIELAGYANSINKIDNEIHKEHVVDKLLISKMSKKQQKDLPFGRKPKDLCHCLHKTSLSIDDKNLKKYYNKELFDHASSIRAEPHGLHSKNLPTHPADIFKTTNRSKTYFLPDSKFAEESNMTHNGGGPSPMISTMRRSGSIQSSMRKVANRSLMENYSPVGTAKTYKPNKKRKMDYFADLRSTHDSFVKNPNPLREINSPKANTNKDGNEFVDKFGFLNFESLQA